MGNKSCTLKKTSIGGQALIEGVMMRGPEKTAMAVRHTSGKIVKEEWETKLSNKPKVWKLPLLRGMYNMVESMVLGYKALMRSAELAGLEDEDEKPTTKAEKVFFNVLMVFSCVFGVAISLGLFMYLPSFIYKWMASLLDSSFATNFWTGNALMRGITEGILRLILFLGYLVIVTMLKDIRRVFSYHGAEHKTIFCYENGEELTVENVRNQSRFHPRCGTSFLVLMLIIGIIMSICIRVDTVWLRVVIKVALLPITVGIGYELIKLAGRKDNWFTRVISAPGLWIQRLTTKEPDDSMIECAIEAFQAVVPEDEKTAQW